MASVRQLNRASKSGAYQYLFNTQRQQSEFIIYIKSFNLSFQFLNNSNTQSHKSLNKNLNSDEGLDSSDDEGLNPSNDEGLHLSNNEDLTEGLTENLAKDLIIQFCNEIESEDLSRQLYESLDVSFSDDQSYQPLFLSKDRTGEPQNLSEDSDSVKLFQLFFSVKEIENIVKEINQHA